jgi:hypothetical protein
VGATVHPRVPRLRAKAGDVGQSAVEERRPLVADAVLLTEPPLLCAQHRPLPLGHP